MRNGAILYPQKVCAAATGWWSEHSWNYTLSLLQQKKRNGAALANSGSSELDNLEHPLLIHCKTEILFFFFFYKSELIALSVVCPFFHQFSCCRTNFLPKSTEESWNSDASRRHSKIKEQFDEDLPYLGWRLELLLSALITNDRVVLPSNSPTRRVQR